MNEPVDLQSMDEAQMRQMLQHLMSELKHKQTLLDKLSYEMAILKRLKFAAKTEALNADQRSLLEDALEEDLQAVAEEIEQLRSAEERSPRQQPKRLPLPAQLLRQEFTHEPEVTECCGQAMRRMGEDVAEKLDYTPGVFTVHRHVRGKWVCACCQTLKQQPVEAHIIDKGLATTGLLAQVLVAKYADHLPLYRQESIYARAGVPLARSTLAQWVGSCGVQLQPLVDALRQEVLAHSIVHADETPVQMLKRGSERDGKTHRAYLWAYTPGRHEDLKAVVYDFCESRAGKHACEFLNGWRGTLLVDDFAGYKQLMGEHITEAACWAHARRKFFELHAANKSQIAEQALVQIGQLYEVERQACNVDGTERLRMRQQHSRPIVAKLHAWLSEHRSKVPEGSATARAIDYSLRRWQALTRLLDNGQLPIDNNWMENQMRPVALGRKNCIWHMDHLRIAHGLDEFSRQVTGGAVACGCVGHLVGVVLGVLHQFSFEPLCNEELVLLVGAKHPLASRKHMRMVELHRREMILPSSRYTTRRMIEEAFAAAGATPIVRAESDSITAMLGTVRQSHLATIVSRHAVQGDSGFKIIALESPTPMRTPGLVRLKGAPLDPAQATLASIIREVTTAADFQPLQRNR